MRDLTEADVHATWGDLFEIAVKRGCLSFLLNKNVLADNPHLSIWGETPVADLIAHLKRQFGVTDPATIERHTQALKHLLLQGWGLGWTVLRSALRPFDLSQLQTIGVYCPCSLPERPGKEPDTRAHEDLWRALRLPGRPDAAWLQKGQPARADFLLWLQEEHEEGLHQHIFVIEFSLNAPIEARDFTDHETHLDEVLAHANRVESRGVFTRIGASLTSDAFVFSDRIVSHLAALTTRDKPLYKLAQASAYASQFILNLEERHFPIVPATAHAIAITNQGIEALSAEYDGADSPRWKLMRALGAAYPQVRLPQDNDREALNAEIENVRGQLIRALPPNLRDAVDEALDLSVPAHGLNFTLSESVPEFVNPADLEPVEKFLRGVDESPDVGALLGTDSPRASLLRDLAGREEVSLREMHAATLRRALTHARPGQITVIAAEGMPGIGKTTAVRQTLQDLSEGFLWLYASPRLLINEDVLQAVVDSESSDIPNVVALTTNSRLVGGASAWWREKHPEERGRIVDGAVLQRGSSVSVPPRGSILFLDQEQALEVDSQYSGSNLRKRNIDESIDEMQQTIVGGVLSTLARATNAILERNPSANRVVLAASIQGFRNLTQSNPRHRARSTVRSLSKLFHERAGTPAGLTERRELARRLNTVVVMVDEIAGDGAGTPFVHELGAWLHQEFIAPFADVGEPSPYRVVLVLADASLANAAVMRSYLEHREGAPEKILVSPSDGTVPFRVTADALEIGGHRYPALHVMADGFPARTLTVDYQVQLTPVARDPEEHQKSVAARRLIAQQQSDWTLHRAAQQIFDALRNLPDEEQVILFAQDKLFLRKVRKVLLGGGGSPEEDFPEIETYGIVLRESQVAVLDSSVSDARRKELLDANMRDRQRVFLMTSSGARGISFPRTSVIIALVPRFSVESGLMEIAQLVYRGRGQDGDFRDRRIVLMLQDFLVTDGPIDDRQWLRRTLDVLSALLLLRATILTRITGDAGLPGQRAAVVPVGRVGTDELTTSLSQAVGPFLRESALYLHEGTNPDLLGLVARAARGVEESFGDLGQSARLPIGRASIVQVEVAEQLRLQITADHALLLDRQVPTVLPEHISMTGSLWLESWQGLSVHERYSFPGQTSAQLQKLQDLRNSLYRIGKDYTQLPKALSRAARNLANLLYRSAELQNRGFQVQREREGARFWICVPCDYLAFGYAESEHGRIARRLDDDAQPVWCDALARLACAEAALLSWDPVIPRYETRPFLTFQTTGDPTGLERAFDDRYFMASTELNLLNTILFVTPDGG